ncbi:MAG: class I SAM-dependent methyltransferase [bacterium]|nr:class I SAM-dependent methyltransferase [bacterium]
MRGKGKEFRRTEAVVSHDYARNYLRETNESFMYKEVPVIKNGKRMLYPVIEHKRFLHQLYAGKIRSLGAKSLLELGSGRGFNVLSLALLCPNLTMIRGVELTKEGVDVARENLKNPPIKILEHLTELNETEMRKRLKEIDIEFVQGTARLLPFYDGSFDVVMSNSVIEQIPNDYGDVFKEAYRVSKGAGIFGEPFKEAQGRDIFRQMYLKNIDYFRYSYKVTEEAGWKIFEFAIPPIQKFHFNTGVLTCLKYSPLR